MKNTIQQYGWIVITVIIIAILIGISAPAAMYLRDNVVGVVGGFGDLMSGDNGSGGDGGSGDDSEPVGGPGLYQTGSNYTALLESWDDLVSSGAIVVNDGVVSVGCVIPDELPAKNEYGFYFGVKYTAVDQTQAYVFYEDGSILSGTPDTPIEDWRICEDSAEYYEGKINSYSLRSTFYVRADGTQCTSSADGDKIFMLGELPQFSGDLLFPSDDSVTAIKESAFSQQTSLTGVKIPTLITDIGDYAFQDCLSLTNVELPDGVTSIGISTFSGCTSLTSINVPDSVTSIGEEAFMGCLNLTSINIPDCVTNINYSTFNYCSSLTNINIPDSVTSIDWRAFYYCTSLTSITYEGTTAEWQAIFLESDWNDNVPCDYIICSDGKICAGDHTGGTVTCQQKAVCINCGNEYGDFGFCNPVDGKCIACGKECTIIESSHSPYANNQNYVVLGTWDYSDASSVTIAITYQTESGSYDWISITSGTDYVAGSSYGSTRTYLNISGNVIAATGTSYSVKFSGSMKQTVTFDNVDMLTGSVIFKTDGFGNDYYGVSVVITPNY